MSPSIERFLYAGLAPHIYRTFIELILLVWYAQRTILGPSTPKPANPPKKQHILQQAPLDAECVEVIARLLTLPLASLALKVTFLKFLFRCICSTSLDFHTYTSTHPHTYAPPTQPTHQKTNTHPPKKQ